MRPIPVTPGDRYGRLTVIAETEPYRAPCGKPFRQCTCRCDCGQITTVYLSSLRKDKTKSCGCWARDVNTKHGLSRTPEYGVWRMIKSRCLDPTSAGYRNYGARGITVCERWLDFEAFYEDTAPRPSPSYSLDRIDNNDGYKPGNVRWATPVDQGRNRRTNRLVTAMGQTRPVVEWSELLGVSAHTLYSRLNRGWTDEATIAEPVREHTAS